MSVSNTSKPAVASFSNTSKDSTTWNRYGKDGAGWLYDQAGITYDATTDSITNLEVKYDSLGTQPSWSNETKISA